MPTTAVYRGNTALKQPLLRYYCNHCSHYHGITAAVVSNTFHYLPW